MVVARRCLNWIEMRPAWLRFGLVIVLLITVAALDKLTGDELSFSLFYLLPVGIAAWLHPTGGLTVSLLAAFGWYVVDRSIGRAYSYEGVVLWNTASRLGFFVVVSILTAALRHAMLREQFFARNDPLTGALNARSFKETMALELERAGRYRHGFTLAYVDLDNFKQVNDSYGHARGDEVLQCVVRTCKSQLRAVDTVARLGGDEFALLLPETTLNAAQMTLEKIRQAVLADMAQQGWPVTLSIGAVSCQHYLPVVEDIVNAADALMYEVNLSLELTRYKAASLACELSCQED